MIIAGNWPWGVIGLRFKIRGFDDCSFRYNEGVPTTLEDAFNRLNGYCLKASAREIIIQYEGKLGQTIVRLIGGVVVGASVIEENFLLVPL